MQGLIRNRTRSQRRESGSTLIEFTLTLLPLLGFIFLLMDVAWIVFAWSSIQEGAREGVRFAVTGQTNGYPCQDAAIRAGVQQYSFGFVTAQNLATAVDIEYYSPLTLQPLSGAGSNAGGNVIKITVGGISIKSLGPILRSVAPVGISATSSDVMEGSPGGTPPCR